MKSFNKFAIAASLALGSVSVKAQDAKVKVQDIDHRKPVTVKADAKLASTLDQMKAAGVTATDSEARKVFFSGDFPKQDPAENNAYVFGFSYPRKTLPNKIRLQQQNISSINLFYPENDKAHTTHFELSRKKSGTEILFIDAMKKDTLFKKKIDAAQSENLVGYLLKSSAEIVQAKTEISTVMNKVKNDYK